MPPKIKQSEKRAIDKKLVGELRRSQLITTFGSGSLVDFPRFSGIMAGLDKWNLDFLKEENIIHERNLEKMLGKKYFYQVASADDDLNKIFTLPAYRFPTWYYCPECHRLDKYKKISKSISGNKTDYNSERICGFCSDKKHKVKLIPSRFVVSCINGHIQDFPYIWWCHRKTGTCSNPRLELEYKGTTGGLDSIHIKCTTCGAETTMAGCMDKDALRGLKCGGSMPWLGYDEKNKQWYSDPNDCKATLRCLQRSANNVYYSVNKSALTIPPWSEKVQAQIAKKESLFKDIFEDDVEEIDRRLRREFTKNRQLYDCDLESFIRAAYIRYADKDEVIDDKTLRNDEYKAFCGEDVDDEYFRTESIEIPEKMRPYFHKIKLVKKLREIMVLQGFRRILPAIEEDQEERTRNGRSERDFAPLSKEELDWLPAIELYGEGIFFELDEEALSKWEDENRDRYIKMSLNHNRNRWIGNGMFDVNSPRYVLLHTLSHLLIRQLTAQCGYATASIKEKIYSTFDSFGTKMCGILIYTSATDTDGSLGGLVREGYADRIEDTFLNMLQDCSWCSNDPLCIESTSQGYENLNYSACHACTLLPETSCESMNCLLDRASVVGTPENKNISFFSDLL